MATAGSGHSGIYNSRSGLPTFGNFGNTLLERSNPGLRKSTPDSEALASSDEEVEHSRIRSLAQSKTNQIRRSSVLAEQHHDNRRLSFTGKTQSPGPGSQPNTPSTSHETWSTISPSVGAWNGASAYPFGTSIWGASSRDPPSRLQEVRNDTDNRLPFSVPSQPNATVQRSMSFSVGQSEYSSTTPTGDSSKPTLTRRTSRPSNLGQDFGGLSRVSESEDANFFTSSTQTMPGKIQARAMSNASTIVNPSSAFQNHPSISRTTSSTSTFRNPRFTTSHIEGPEIAIDDAEETMAQSRYPIHNAPSRRLSDYQAVPTRQPQGPPFSSAGFGSTRNAPHWSSNLDFGQLDPIPQSRRHSFADIPTRRGSLDTHEEDEQSYEDGSQGGVQVGHEPSYFNSNDVTRRVTEQEVQRQIQHEHHQAVFGVTGPYGIPTNAPSSIGSFHGPNTAPLYVVNFKCCRSDIFYIQEGTGLSVKDGDLVIVEADRGTDLGCVQHTNVSLDAARKFKAKYAEQHFGWLMMFSQQTRAGAGNLFNPNAVAPGGKVGSGAAGPGQQGTAIRDSELKPKMIKRLAQAHEIQALQEKEGNEAKAKRVCQQKVVEHSLNMEILDAEFQMDGKKLTFYFFSTEYINFNSLVTDLFKMYKTRIWMSAINPASFQSPVSSLGLTPLYGNAGLGLGTSTQTSNMYDDSREDNRFMSMNMTANQAPQSAQHMSPHHPMPHHHQPHRSGMPPLYFGGYGQTPQLPPEYSGATYPPSYTQPPSDPFSGYSPVNGASVGYNMGGSTSMRSLPHHMSFNGRADTGYGSGIGSSPANHHTTPTRNLHQHPSSSSLANQFGSLSMRG